MKPRPPVIKIYWSPNVNLSSKTLRLSSKESEISVDGVDASMGDRGSELESESVGLSIASKKKNKERNRIEGNRAEEITLPSPADRRY